VRGGEVRVREEGAPRSADGAEAAELLGREAQQDLVEAFQGQWAGVGGVVRGVPRRGAGRRHSEGRMIHDLRAYKDAIQLVAFNGIDESKVARITLTEEAYCIAEGRSRRIPALWRSGERRVAEGNGERRAGGRREGRVKSAAAQGETKYLLFCTPHRCTSLKCTCVYM
jgi:hypothetical protein